MRKYFKTFNNKKVFYDIRNNEAYGGQYVAITGADKDVTKIAIPDEIAGIPVRVIAKNAFENHESLEDVKFSDNIIEIEDEAFSGCSALKEIATPKNLQVLGDAVFANCSKLKKVTLNEGVLDIPSLFIADCPQIEKFTVPNSVLSIQDDAFACCNNLRNVIIGANVEQISEEAFNCTPSMENFIVDENNKTFATYDGVLYADDFGELVSYPQGRSEEYYVIDPWAVVIRDLAFQDCTNLRAIYIPDGVDAIGFDSFAGCDLLAYQYDSIAYDDIRSNEMPERNEFFKDSEEINLVLTAKEKRLCLVMVPVSEEEENSLENNDDYER